MTQIFVYGTLKRNCCRSHVLQGQRFVGERRTAARYRMLDAGSFPAMVEDLNGLAIEGELWEVDEECLRILDGMEGVPILYERKPVVLESCDTDDVETYLYRQSVEGMPDCGCCWKDEPDAARGAARANNEPIYAADALSLKNATARRMVNIVCVGDSITGWNNFGPPQLWPFPTYPRFLQLLCAPQGLRVADGGIAGEVSDRGLDHVRRYLQVFPNATFFVVGFGTNDLGLWPDLEFTSSRIIANLQAMVSAIRGQGKQPILFNVPYVKESAFTESFAGETHGKRDYHNARLAEFCRREELPLADICSRLDDQHFGDELHPNEAGAKVIAEEVFRAFISIYRPGSMY